MQIGKVGVWSFQLLSGSDEQLAEVVTEIEELGYGAVWYPGGPPSAGITMARRVLVASRRIAVATGIVNIWAEPPEDVAIAHRALRDDHPGRFLLGLGVSHPEALDRQQPGRYARPVESMAAFLDGLDAADPDAPKDERVLAALGPRMLELAATRASGAHPYFVPVEHTASARNELGPKALLAPEQAFVIETDASKAREIARNHMAIYLGLRNYCNNLRRLGFSEADLADGGSDKLVDAIVAWGDVEAVAERVQAHHEAGADHVCVQVLGADRRSPPRLEDYRRLALALKLAV